MSDGEAPRGWAATVDERLIARCEKYRRDGERRRAPSLPTWLRPMDTHLRPEDWNTGFLAVREREIPEELQADLRQRMPQALLRDLHRLVRDEGWVAREPLMERADPQGRQALAEARAMRQPLARPPIEPSTRVMRALQTWRRALLSERWQPLLADDDPRRYPAPGGDSGSRAPGRRRGA